MTRDKEEEDPRPPEYLTMRTLVLIVCVLALSAVALAVDSSMALLQSGSSGSSGSGSSSGSSSGSASSIASSIASLSASVSGSSSTCAANAASIEQLQAQLDRLEASLKALKIACDPEKISKAETELKTARTALRELIHKKKHQDPALQAAQDSISAQESSARADMQQTVSDLANAAAKERNLASTKMEEHLSQASAMFNAAKQKYEGLIKKTKALAGAWSWLKRTRGSLSEQMDEKFASNAKQLLTFY